jgi:adenosylhomocysteinase
VADYGIATYAIRGEDSKTYYKHINQALDLKPTLTLDDGADLVTAIHQKRPGAHGGPARLDGRRPRPA